MQTYQVGDFHNNYEVIGTALFRVCHINLAKGFRGGERQTELLIKALCSHQDISQRVVVRKNSPLTHRLDGLGNTLELQSVAKPYLRYASCIRDCSLIHAHDAKAAQFAYLATRIFRRPYMITRRVPNIIKSNPLSRNIYVKAVQVVSLSHAISNALKCYDDRLQPIVIPSMVSNLPFDPLARDDIKRRYAGKFLIGHAGALVNRHKGQQYILEAAKIVKDACPDMHFLLLGQGEDEKWLRSLAGHLDNVTFVGFRENIGDYLSAFDLFVFPSLQEGLGSVLLDAMQFRLPIVASDVDGIPDIIEHERTGVLVTPGDGEALAEAIERLYRDEEMRRFVSENAYTESLKFHPGEIAIRYIRVYREICSSF